MGMLKCPLFVCGHGDSARHSLFDAPCNFSVLGFACPACCLFTKLTPSIFFSAQFLSMLQTTEEYNTRVRAFKAICPFIKRGKGHSAVAENTPGLNKGPDLIRSSSSYWWKMWKVVAEETLESPCQSWVDNADLDGPMVSGSGGGSFLCSNRKLQQWGRSRRQHSGSLSACLTFMSHKP